MTDFAEFVANLYSEMLLSDLNSAELRTIKRLQLDGLVGLDYDEDFDDYIVRVICR